MFNSFEVKSYLGIYNVDFVPNALEQAQALLGPKDIIIVDRIVMGLYPQVKEFVEANTAIIIDADEEAKDFEKLAPIIQKMIESNMGNDAQLVAIGGGVVQDIVSFTASIFKRGIKWVFIPTTLLAQCDSCIGSKTSINFRETKNQLGSFHPPSQILIDVNYLKTLPKIEIQAGIGEMFHYFLVTEGDHFTWAAENLEEALTDWEMLSKFIWRSLSIKRKMIEIDEFDKGPRQVFNYGHTFGHALEAASNHSVPHGIAVAIGMELSNRISCELDYISAELKAQISQALKLLWRNTECPKVDIDDYWSALRRDKKNTGSNINAILSRGVGDMFRESLPDSEVIETLINNYISKQEWHNV